MNSLNISGEAGSSEIFLNGKLDDLNRFIKNRKTCIITDENVHHFYKDQFPSDIPIIVVPAGENSKTIESAGSIHRKLVELEMDRGSLLIGIGGGVITDLTGFVASTFLRGIAFGFAATTILAQVDAAIGGKNGVNLDGYKNLVGIIRQPEFVLIAADTLSTLPREELVNGMAEVIKCGLIADIELFNILADAAKNENPFKHTDLALVCGMAAKVKVDVVNIDVFEKGVRRHLNLGHTLGHAIEKLKKIPHGFGVSAGIIAAAKISIKEGLISKDVLKVITETLGGYGLPLSYNITAADAMDAILKDKKRKADKINLVLLENIGKATVKPFGFTELENALVEALK
ncbi:MAG: 3-dehydroquinate synthase [Deltaproteobacteria bacterium]|nr:3-dehydroquinate synthase [Deltaproteobacteria bacterium]